MNRVYEAIAERAGFRCENCRAPAALFNFSFEIEHVIPTSRGGDDSAENLALACRACNGFKEAAIDGLDPDTNAEAELFHPRRYAGKRTFSSWRSGRRSSA